MVQKLHIFNIKTAYVKNQIYLSILYGIFVVSTIRGE